FKMPAARAEDLIGKAAAFRREGDAVTATLSPEVAGELLEAEGPVLFRRRRGGARGGGGGLPVTRIQDPRGSVTFRIDGGVLTEVALTLSGSRRLMGNEIRLDRTTTTKIGDIGSTKVDVPEDAREIVEALIAGRRPDVFAPEPGFRKL